MVEILSTASAIASIVSAIVAVVSATKATKRKSEVERYRNELLSRQDLGEIIKIRVRAEQLSAAYQSYASDPKQITKRGESYRNKAVELQSFINEAEEIAKRLELATRRSAAKDLKELRAAVKQIADLEPQDLCGPLMLKTANHLERIRITIKTAHAQGLIGQPS